MSQKGVPQGTPFPLLEIIMMAWYLNEDISFCELDSRLFFLDIQNDRYFQLSKELERSFRHHLENPEDFGIDISQLAKHNLLKQPHSPTNARPMPWLDSIEKSIHETPGLNEHVYPDMILDVFFIVITMHWRLKRQRLKKVLDTVDKYRHIRTSSTPDDVPKETPQHLVNAAAAFNRIRHYVPIETCCLLDSLSMITFLANRGLPARLIIGVACDPFSAHAWAQSGSLVLNETVGTAQSHVPIRVI